MRPGFDGATAHNAQQNDGDTAAPQVRQIGATAFGCRWRADRWLPTATWRGVALSGLSDRVRAV